MTHAVIVVSASIALAWILSKLTILALDEARRFDESRIPKSKLTVNELALAGAKVSLKVGYGLYNGKEILQLINPHGMVVFQRIHDGSNDFWEKVRVDGFAVIDEASERLWPKQ